MESGLKTEDSLNKLYVEIDTILHQYETSQKNRNSKSWLKDALHFKSQHSTINIFSIIFGLWTSISLLLGYILEGDNVGGYEAIPILLLIFINILLEIYNNKLRHNEIPNKIRHVLDKLKSQQQNIKWSVENYPNLNSPISPCITLQWTFRDGQLVNLPWALLVKDDIILLRPGQASPGYCESLDKHSEFPLLHAKEIFCPSLQNANENFSTPKFRKPLEPKKYRLLETPYLNNLKIFLEKALDRPVSQLNQQRHLVTMRIVEQILLPLTFFLVLVVNLFRYFYFHKYLGRYLVSNTMFIVPCNVVLPLLPMVFPLFWNIANYLGIARFKTIFDITTKPADKDSELAEDTDIVAEDLAYIDITKKDIFKNFIKIFKGKPEILSRSTNILHVLGSVSAFGCVDKKGILSWPNPTAEKVFFLHNEDDVSQSSSMDNINDLAADHEPTVPIGSPKNAVFEVLDVTHKSNDPFKLYFDEPDWKEHISSLKPLGLAILLNTCNIDTQDNYTLFCSHITCEAVYNENLVPVTNRRCLCEVAKEIGFVDEARKIFTLEEQLSSFRHLQPEMVRKDNKYARSLQLSTKLKFPFPNTFAVVVKEQSTGNAQLFSEGTADLVLDSCVEYWNGHGLIPLSISDKKRILDFYQRCSLTAYCTAFSYRPLSPMIHSKLSDVYLEVPSDSRHLYMSQRSPTPMQWEFKKILDPTFESSQQFVSTDSLLFNDNSTIHVSDAETCFQIQCNQIFIGMVTMQYQAMTDIVHLIEQLERACIRFVHFSKENELRSRVFNEKMGLESGWNCHISLLSERNSNLESSRTMSFSAPSAINTDYSVVKFDTEVDRINIELKQSECGDTEFTSQESIPLQADSNTHEWQSLSNMTESTEQSVPINFDMSNRAKLPRGIDKIRPHIELIDNVPLLVSLYTDCTPDVTKEMLKIMQEYKEIVCIIGSSENCDNAGIFMQADASISIEPLFTQVCQKREAFKKPTGCLSPIDFSFELNSIPCSLSVKRRDPFSIFRLIMESRHFVASLWNSGQFWLCSCVSLSVLQMLATFVMLPGLLTTGQVLWFSCVVVPLISISLLFTPVDSNVMKKPQGKMQAVCNWDAISFILWCYGTKFLTTFAVVLISFVGILTSHCDQICNVLPNCTCAFYYNPVIFTEEISMGGWDENEWTLLTARLIISFIILLHLVAISSGFIHRNHSIFKRSPHSNFIWLSSVFILIIIQSVYTLVVYTNFIETQKEDRKFEIPTWIIGFAAVSPLLVWIVNELVKKQEIMLNDRYLKRARLDFGTKLGMNSPF